MYREVAKQIYNRGITGFTRELVKHWKEDAQRLRRIARGRWATYMDNVFADTTFKSHKVIFNFDKDFDRERINCYDDRAFGGCSTAEMRPGPTGETMVLEGEITPELAPEARQFLKRMRQGGFAGFHTRQLDHEPEFLDLRSFHGLTIRHRGDGRVYMASLRAYPWGVMNPDPDVYQTTLWTRDGEWHEEQICLSEFQLTHKGRVVPVLNHNIPTHCIVCLGISVSTGHDIQPPGPFRIELDWIKGHREPVPRRFSRKRKVTQDNLAIAATPQNLQIPARQLAIEAFSESKRVDSHKWPLEWAYLGGPKKPAAHGAQGEAARTGTGEGEQRGEEEGGGGAEKQQDQGGSDVGRF